MGVVAVVAVPPSGMGSVPKRLLPSRTQIELARRAEVSIRIGATPAARIVRAQPTLAEHAAFAIGLREVAGAEQGREHEGKLHLASRRTVYCDSGSGKRQCHVGVAAKKLMTPALEGLSD